MSLKEDYEIVRIPFKVGAPIIIKEHYLHRVPPCSFTFALMQGLKVFGVIMYGTPSSAPLRGGICGKDERMNVIELSRLWVDDSVVKNGESYLIGNTIRKVDKEIIVSFADSKQGHIGIVYQATNWLYTGLSAKRTSWHVDGSPEKHGQTWANKYSSAEMRDKYGDRFKLVDRSRKHRYIYFNCDKYRKRELLEKLRYPIKPYPKNMERE